MKTGKKQATEKRGLTQEQLEKTLKKQLLSVDREGLRGLIVAEGKLGRTRGKVHLI